MKLILLALLTLSTLTSVNVFAAPSCGGDGDGSTLFYCETLNHDIAIDGNFNSNGENTARAIVKRRDENGYSGTEVVDLKLSAPTDYVGFKVTGRTPYSTRIRIVGLNKSVREICKGDSATFKAVIEYKELGLLPDGRAQMSCAFYTAH